MRNNIPYYFLTKQQNIKKKFYFKEVSYMSYECPCGYIYDPETGDPDGGIAPGTAWEDIPEDWVCPVCGLSKDSFTQI